MKKINMFNQPSNMMMKNYALNMMKIKKCLKIIFHRVTRTLNHMFNLQRNAMKYIIGTNLKK